jgi:hypothetical protein
LNQIITETQDAQRLSNQALSVAVNDQIGLLEHTSNTNQENIEKLIKRMEEIQNSFAQNFDINTNSMKKVMTTSMNHIEKGAQNFTSSFSDVANSVNNLKVSIDSATEIIENWDSSVERILSTDNAIQNNILASSESLNAVQANLITLANSMPELLGKAVSNFENGTINLANQISKNENLINQSWIKLENSISKFTIQMGILVNKIENDKIKSSDQVNVMLTSGSKNE